MPDLIDDRYELLEVLASGGMATVWRARDTRLDRMVALKRPHPAPPDDPVHARIEREARAAASLSHPHLVTIYDVGRDDEGPFLVMELVEGPTLSDVGPGMTTAEATQVIAQIADALAVVHSAGIVHRDVKPANVLMSERGPQLTDFGIAVAGDSARRLTEEGSLVATPSYASPEQLAGGPATAKSDIFSLGVMLYELVAGHLPFTDIDRARSPAPVGDPSLDTVLDQVLSPDPAQRPDAAELARLLRSSAPTTTMQPAGGSTIPMAITSPEPDRHAAVDRPRRAPLFLAGIAVLAAVALAAALIDLSTDDPVVGDTQAGASVPPSTTTPTTLPTSTSPATTSTTTVSTTEASFSAPLSVEEARDGLEAALSSAHPSDLKPNDVRDLMGKADDAIEAIEEDKDKEAGKKLREIAKEIDDKLEGEIRDDSLESLVALAEALGISLEPDEDD